MKKTVAILLAICFFIGVSGSVLADEEKSPIKAWVKAGEKLMITPCPKTTMVKDCLECHRKGDFKIKEIDTASLYSSPYGSTVLNRGGEKTLYYLLKSVDDDIIFNLVNYYRRHPEFKRIIIEMYSPGGSMMAAWRIVGLMNELKGEGVKIETVCHGFAASAGFMIFVNGSKGFRSVSHTSLMMWHEVQTFKMFDVSNPSDKEEESRILRMFQDNANNWLASRSNLKKEDIDDMIRKKEMWMTGAMAYGYGFADKVIK